MEDKKQSITEIALNAIRDSEKYMSARKCLDFLTDPAAVHFKDFRTQLKELRPSLSEKEMMDILSQKLFEYDQTDNTPSTLNAKKAVVKNWFSKGTTPGRPYVIKTAFAFELNLEETNDLLRKGSCDHFLNIRSAQEAIYMYCIINNKPYSCAAKLIKRFNSEQPSNPTEKESSSVLNFRSGTTQIMANTMSHSSWESDDLFYNTFLNEYRDNFTDYSKTALYYYYQLYKDLSLNIISNDTESECENIKSVSKGTGSFLGRIRKVITSEERFQADLGKRACELDDKYLAFSVWLDVQSKIEDIFEEDPEEALRILRMILPVDLLIKAVYSDIPFHRTTRVNKKGDQITEGNFESFKNSSLSDSVLNDFPAAAKLRAIEKDPAGNIFNKSTRKTLVLFYFLNYFFDWVAYTEEKNFRSFYESLNDILIACSLAPLYPADPFDWLVLKCVMQYEVKVQYDSDFEPAEAFSEIIRLSFEKDTEE